jgi:hypothetical protein
MNPIHLLTTYQNRLWALGEQISISGLSFTLNFLLASILSKQLFGEYSAILIMQLLLLGLFQNIVILPLQVFWGQYRNGDFTPIVLLRRAYFVFIPITFLLTSVLIHHLRLTSTAQFSSRYYLVLPLGFIATLTYELLRRYCLFANFKKQVCVVSFMLFIWQVCIVVIFHNKQSVLYIFQLLSIGYFLFSILLFVFALKDIKATNYQSQTDPSLATNYYKIVRWNTLIALLTWFAGNQLLVIASQKLGMETLAELRLAQTIWGIFHIFLIVIENNVPSKLSEILQAKGPLFFTSYLKQTAIKLYCFLMVIAVAIMFFAPHFLNFFLAETYAKNASIIYKYAFQYFPIILAIPFRFYLMIKQKNNVFFFGYLMNATLVFFIGDWLVASYQIDGILYGFALLQWLILIFYALMAYSIEVKTTRLL